METVNCSHKCEGGLFDCWSIHSYS